MSQGLPAAYIMAMTSANPLTSSPGLNIHRQMSMRSRNSSGRSVRQKSGPMWSERSISDSLAKFRKVYRTAVFLASYFRYLRDQSDETSYWMHSWQRKHDLRSLHQLPVCRHVWCADIHEYTAIVRDMEQFACQYITLTSHKETEGSYSQQSTKGWSNPVEPVVITGPGDQGRPKASCWIQTGTGDERCNPYHHRHKNPYH